jgi:hypothetical protein
MIAIRGRGRRLLILLVLPVAVLGLSWPIWKAWVAESLVCEEQAGRSDALLVENFDPDYLVFERARSLHRAGMGGRVIVPVSADGSGEANAVSKGIAEVMAGIAHLPAMELVPIGQTEPISLNAAQELRDFMTRERIGSVTVVTPGLRSRRSLLVYSTVFTPVGIAVRCVPVFGTTTPANWTESWHGIQGVVEQFGKLQYYRFWVFV